jgi:tryptophanyl-tRNA synthetase
MSKSDTELYSNILLTTPPDQIRKIIFRALTDSLPGVYASPERPAITNLLNLLSAFENIPVSDLETELRNSPIKTLKERVTESITNGLKDIQSRYAEVQGNTSWLEKIRKQGNEQARQVAAERITEIKKVVGLL